MAGHGHIDPRRHLRPGRYLVRLLAARGQNRPRTVTTVIAPARAPESRRLHEGGHRYAQPPSIGSVVAGLVVLAVLDRAAGARGAAGVTEHGADTGTVTPDPEHAAPPSQPMCRSRSLQARLRSTYFWILPVEVFGSSPKVTDFGALNRASRRADVLEMSSWVALAPSFSVTYAAGTSPQRSSGIPMTATSSTAGWSRDGLLDLDRGDVLAAGDDHVLLRPEPTYPSG